jgi:hypothetical protein
MFVAPTHIVGVHATDHSCGWRSSASRFMPEFMVESFMLPRVCVFATHALFCQCLSKSLDSYREIGVQADL